MFLQGRPPDWQDFIGIVVLLIINSTISFIEENNAGNAAAALMAGLAPKTKVTTQLSPFNYWIKQLGPDQSNRPKLQATPNPLVFLMNSTRIYIPTNWVKVNTDSTWTISY